MKISIREQAVLSCRKLLSQLNRDPATPTYGCFDRRYWAWKLADFPEATFQRNAAALGWYIRQEEAQRSIQIQEAIRAAILYAFKIQHKDGSFDQAYPNERSYGATAFLLPDLISAFSTIEHNLDIREAKTIRSRLCRSADFLCASSEQHGLISNHIAGAALGLQKAGNLFENDNYLEKSSAIVAHIIAHQSNEGWYVEYDGADPGYQTLCMYYLAQIYQNDPTDQLKRSLAKSLEFLQYFVHPDGTFGGEYGSRRTEVYYPGGIALLAKEFPIAARLNTYMAKAIETGKTTTPMDIDFGNNAPLLQNYILAAENEGPQSRSPKLPFEKNLVLQSFSAAGLGIKGDENYYCIFGASNGGVFRVFGKRKKELVYDDCGILGETDNGQTITCQVTDHENAFTSSNDSFASKASFSSVNSTSPTPFNYLFLRMANLTFMRFTKLNEWIKKLMVKALISRKSDLPLSRERKIIFSDRTIRIEDTVTKNGNIQLTWLKQGIKFSSIHMASSRYFSPSQLKEQFTQEFDCDELNQSGNIHQIIEIDAQTGTVTGIND